MVYLVHHGILGQKWGVRRYQNEDGSLTDAGRRRKRITGAAKAAGAIGAATGAAVYASKNQKAVNAVSKAGHGVGYAAGKTVGYAKDPKIARTAVNATQKSVDAIKTSRKQSAEAEATARARQEARQMSDAELKQVVARMNLEQQYVNMSKNSVNSGRDTVNKILDATSITLGLLGAGLTIAVGVKGLKK